MTSGTYAMRNHKLVLINDKIPSLNVHFGCRFDGPYYSEELGYLKTKEDKYNALKEKGLMEYDPKAFSKKPVRNREKETEQFAANVLDKLNVNGVKNWKGVK